MSKPVYVFVGGVSHTPEFFEATIKALAELGYDSTAVAYPTCSKDTSKVQGTKQWDEVIEIQRVVKQQLDEKNRDVVLVLHSYGGMPGSRAVKGLDKEARTKEGKATGIVEVVFLAAFLLPDNAVKKDFSYLPPWLTVENECRIPNESAIPLLFSDISAEEGKKWHGKLEWQFNDLVEGTLPDAPWKLSVNKTYIVTTDDKTATTDFQFDMLKPTIDATWAVKSIKSGHSPFLSQPVNLAKVLVTPTY